MKCLFITMVFLASTMFYYADTTKKENLVTEITIPLSGNKTTFRFSVKNVSDKKVDVYSPFANLTRLLVTHPDGEKREHLNWKEGIGPTDSLLPQKSMSWDVDVQNWVKFKRKGRYIVSFSVNGIESNTIIVVRD